MQHSIKFTPRLTIKDSAIRVDLKITCCTKELQPNPLLEKYVRKVCKRTIAPYLKPRTIDPDGQLSPPYPISIPLKSYSPEGTYIELDLSGTDIVSKITDALDCTDDLRILKLRVRIPVSWAWVKVGWFEAEYATHYAYQINDTDIPYDQGQQDLTLYIRRLEAGLKRAWLELKAGSSTLWDTYYGRSTHLKPVVCGLALIMASVPTEIIDGYGRPIDPDPETGMVTLAPPPQWSYCAVM